MVFFLVASRRENCLFYRKMEAKRKKNGTNRSAMPSKYNGDVSLTARQEKRLPLFVLLVVKRVFDNKKIFAICQKCLTKNF